MVILCRNTISMEEDQKPQEEVQEQTAPAPFKPVAMPSSNKKGKNLLVLLVVLVVFGVIGFLLFKGGSQKEATPTPAPTISGISVTSTPVSTPTPSPVAKDKIKIEIQNGTGITGEAAYLQGKLKGLGYSDIKAGNADKQDYETTMVTFSKETPSVVQEEIKTELEKIYTKVEVKTSSTQKANAVIITGLRKGQSPKPSPTATPTASPSASPTASPTPTATPST